MSMKTLLIIIHMTKKITCTILFPRHFMSDSDCENMEKAVWMAEKHPQCASKFLLAGNVDI